MPFPGKPSPVIQKPLTLSTTMYTLRQKLVLATVVVFSIATLSILAATRWIVMDAVAMETTRAGARSASLLSAAVTPLLIQSDMASLDELTQSLVHSGDFSHLQVIDRLGEVVATAGTRSETDAQIFSHDLTLGGQAYGRATFGIARTGEHAVAKHVLGELLLVCLGTLALGAAVQVYIAHALTARLATLRSGADRMAAGEANVQIDSIGTDELAMLAAAFNRMSTILSQRFSALEEAERMLKEYSESLERRVSERTNHLEQTLLQLRQAQDELVEAKKLSSLGNLVAGISHELNTPIGNAITTTTSLQHLLHNTERTVNQQMLTRKGLLDALGLGQQMADLVLKATQKAATLVSSFKRVAAHDTGQRRKPFDLATLVSGTVAAWVKTVKPMIGLWRSTFRRPSSWTASPIRWHRWWLTCSKTPIATPLRAQKTACCASPLLPATHKWKFGSPTTAQACPPTWQRACSSLSSRPKWDKVAQAWACPSRAIKSAACWVDASLSKAPTAQAPAWC
jgi:methyl-accepting chemotaxis protein